MSYRHKSKTTRHLLVICLLDDALAIRHEAQDGLRMDITLRKVRAYPITEEQTQKDVLARIGWFDVAVEIEVDASGSALGATKVLVNPDLDVKDTDRNRQGFAKMALAGWESAEKVPAPRLAPNSTTRTEPQQAVWDEFAIRYPETRKQVETLLSEGKNVVAVIGNGVAVCCPYRKTNEPRAVSFALAEELVRETGVPLAVSDEGWPRFAFLAWKSSDAVDSPSELASVFWVSRAQRGGTVTLTKKMTLDEIM